MFGWVPRARFEALELEYRSVCSEADMLRAENAQLRTANAALTERVTGLVTLGDNLKEGQVGRAEGTAEGQLAQLLEAAVQ